VGKSEDERRGIRNPSFVLSVAVDAKALLNGSLQLRDHLQVALDDGHRENGFENLVIGILACCFLRSLGEAAARSSADTVIPRILTVRKLEASSILFVDSLTTRSSHLTAVFSLSRDMILSLRVTISF
jgi:hypothetical protein